MYFAQIRLKYGPFLCDMDAKPSLKTLKSHIKLVYITKITDMLCTKISWTNFLTNIIVK